jgi:mono/diheme cytochrome c family protein
VGAIGLLVLAGTAAPDGRERAALGQFFGRFHPMMLHVPIGLILLVPVLELAGRAQGRSELRSAAGFVLGLATATALGTAAQGWLLAWSGGYKGATVIQHMWGGAAFATLCVVTCTLRLKASRLPYSLSLFATLAVMAWASHLGGNLSHGNNYLTEYLPARLRSILPIAKSAKGTGYSAVSKGTAKGTGYPTVYAKQIQPIFDHSCVSCHGPEKVKGGLKLDTFANLMEGGENGAEVVPWQPAKSEVVRRLHLDPDDDDFMPSNGKNLLTDEQKALIDNWIKAGATDLQPLLDR